MKKVYIATDETVLITINSIEYKVQEYEYLACEFDDKMEIFVARNDIEEKLYYNYFQNTNNVQKPDMYVCGTDYDILFLSRRKVQHFEQNLSITEDVSIYILDNEITINFSEQQKNFETIHSIVMCRLINKISNVAKILLENAQGQKILINIFLETKEIQTLGRFDYVQTKDNKIYAIRKNNDIIGSGVLTVIESSGKIVSKKSVKLDERKQYNYATIFIRYLQNYKNGLYRQNGEIISNDIKSVSLEKIKEYLGNIYKIIPLTKESVLIVERSAGLYSGKIIKYNNLDNMVDNFEYIKN